MKNAENITSYLEDFPQEVQDKIHQIRNLASEIFTNTTECIKYGIPTFTYMGKNAFHVGAYAHHIGLYPGAKAVEEFSSLFQDYKQSKGTIQIPLSQPLPMSEIRQLMQFCKSEIENKTHKKKKA